MRLFKIHLKSYIPSAVLCCVALPLGAEQPTGAPPVMIGGFEAADLPATVQPFSAELELVEGRGVTEGKQALRLKFTPNQSYSGIELRQDDSWDCRPLGNCRLSFDATNPGKHSVHLTAKVESENGGRQTRSISIPAGGTDTCYFELQGANLWEDLGMRDDPPSLKNCGRKMIVKGTKQPVYYPKVRSIRFYVEDLLVDKELVLDNIRIISNPPTDPDYLKGLVDPFGQNAKVDFDGKIASVPQLQQLAKQELETLAGPPPSTDRSKFGGWKRGPRQKGNGYFRAEKVDNRWALVDPEGYLYFATGIANIRMSDTSTFTGVDFIEGPRQSGGHAKSAGKTEVVSELRHRMFNWLPGPEDPLSNYYSYRHSVHSGPLKRGQTFSFYLANLTRRYQTANPAATLAKWREVTLDRMINWGFTSLGNWTDPAFYRNERIPYFANGWITGGFKTVSSGNDYWGALPDPFDPEFVKQARKTAGRVAKEVAGSPWCVGVFIDNEMSWGMMGSTQSQFGVVLDALKKPADESPAKARFMEILIGKHGSIDAANQAWGTNIASWQNLAAGLDQHQLDHPPALLADYSLLLESYASEYYKVVHNALAEVMPDHMYLGSRLTTWGLTPEIWKGARKYCDVMSYNCYSEGLDDATWGFLREVDMPSLIGEFHMGSSDTGVFHPGIIHASDQADRAKMWRAYMDSVVANPHLVGAHWFQYIDSPITGRAHDGENYNVGFVSVADVPYPHLIQATKRFHKSLYETRFGGGSQKTPSSR